jgi:integrase
MQEPKTATSRRAVPMLPSLRGLLHDHFEAQGGPSPEALLFTRTGTQPLDPANVRKEFLEALKQAGVKHATLHSLRHTFASVMLSSGASIKALQRSLGHASATMTLNTYSHLIQEDLGASLLRADQVFSKRTGEVIQMRAGRV